MKHQRKAWLCLSLLAPAAAMAQTTLGGSNVVFYGKVDLAIDMTNFSSTPTRGASSSRNLSNDISYWGLRGSEDLGGDMRAYFKLESGFAADTGASTGTNSQLFDRESYVGLGGKWGSIQLGSQWTPSLYLQARSDPFSRQGNGSGIIMTQQSPSNPRGFVGSVTQPNAIQYNSPMFDGVTAHVLYGLSERVDAPRTVGSMTDIGLNYLNGPLFVGASYEDQIMPTTPAGGALSNRTLALGGSYDFKFIKLFGYAMKNTITGSSHDVKAYYAGFNLPIDQSTIKATYSGRKMDNGGNASFFALGYYYDLSKRTTLYTSFAHLNNGAATNFGLWPGLKTYSPPPIAGGSGLPVAGQSVNNLEFGIRHTF